MKVKKRKLNIIEELSHIEQGKSEMEDYGNSKVGTKDTSNDQDWSSILRGQDTSQEK